MTSFPTGLQLGQAIDLKREDVRSRLAYIIIGLLAVLSVGLVAYVWIVGVAAQGDTLITGIFAPIIGIAGTVLGFYFGSKSE